MSNVMSITEFITHPRVRRWLPTALNGGMLLLLVASLAQWTWLLIRPPLPPLVIAPPPPPAPATTFSLQPLLAAHLFGQASQELNGRGLDNLPVSSLNLIVTGVIASSAGGYALISVNGQSQEPFAVGRTVADGVLLQAVYSDRVVILRNGALESLLLEGADKLQALQHAVAAPAVNSQAPQHAAAPAVNPPAEVSVASNQYLVQHDPPVVQASMEQEDLMNQATLMPSSSGGVEVRLIQPGSVYEKLRMRSGDVIKSVNGQEVSTEEDAITLYQQMPRMGAVQVEIVRRGKSEFLNYEFAQN